MIKKRNTKLYRTLGRAAAILLLCCLLMNGTSVSALIVEDPVDKGGGGQPTAGILPLPDGLYLETSESGGEDSGTSSETGGEGESDGTGTNPGSGSENGTEAENPDNAGQTGSQSGAGPENSSSGGQSSTGAEESNESDDNGSPSSNDAEENSEPDDSSGPSGDGTGSQGNDEQQDTGTADDGQGDTGGEDGTNGQAYHDAEEGTDKRSSANDETDTRLSSGDSTDTRIPANDGTNTRLLTDDEINTRESTDSSESTAAAESDGNDSPASEHALAVEDTAQGVVFYVEQSRQNAEVEETYAPWIDLQNLPERSEVQVFRNGEEIPYSMADGRLLIRSEDVEDGKNRITVKVTGPDGTVTEMEPWEFYRGDLYENSPYAIIGGQADGEEETDAALREGEDALKKKKKQKSKALFIIVLALLVGSLAFLGYSAWRLVEAQNREEQTPSSQAEAPTAALPSEEPETESVVPEQEAEPTATPTPEPTATPTPLPTMTPTPEPNPRTALKVAIDPGHQLHGNSEQEPIGPGASATKAKVTSGTSGAASGLDEYELNLIVSLQLRDELVRRGYQVYMVRETHDVNISNRERAEAAARENADIFVRIHANGSGDPSVAGALMYEPTSANPFLSANVITESQRLSEILLKAYIEETGAIDRGIISGDDMSGINWSTIPVTIVEMGFMSNPEEDLKMASEEYQKKIVNGLANGIDDYFAVPRMAPAVPDAAAGTGTETAAPDTASEAGTDSTGAESTAPDTAAETGTDIAGTDSSAQPESEAQAG